MKFNKINNEEFNISDSLEMIEEIFDMTIDDLFNEMVLSKEDLETLNSNEEISKEIFEKIYNFAYNHKLNINDILWLESKEQISQDSILLVHGSRENIKGDIRLDASGESNDFGNGFYCGENLKQAGMFVSQETNPSLYLIEFNFLPDDLIPIKFNVSTDWMLAVAYYRDTLGKYKDSEVVKEVIDKVKQADYIVAPIADNRMFQIIDAFVDGQITDVQCRHALASTNLGQQYVFKTEKSLAHLDILNHLYLCDTEKNRYNINSQEESNTSLLKANIAKYKFKDSGKYISELLN